MTVDAACAAAAFADADAGTGKTVLLSGYALTGADAANYTLIAQPTGITADITKAAITVTPDAGQGKTYGEDDPTPDLRRLCRGQRRVPPPSTVR